MKGKIDTDRFVVRDEVFGGTLYDKKELRHKYLTSPEVVQCLEDKLSWDGTPVRRAQYLRGFLDGIPQDIIYSPVRVYYELTTRCNLRCRTCFNSSGMPHPDELDEDQVIDLLDGMRRKDNILDIRFTGGECTRKPGWDTILQYAKDLGFAISMNTNGVLDEKTIHAIAAIKPHQVTVSFDGLKDTHDYVRGKGNFDRSYATLQALHDLGVVCRTNTLVTEPVTKEAERMIEKFKPYVDVMAFFNMRMMGRALTMQDRGIDYATLEAFNKRMDQIVPRHPEIKIYYHESAELENNAEPGNPQGLRVGHCPGGVNRFVMTSNGDLHVCGYMPYIDPENPVPGAFVGNAVKDGNSIIPTWRYSPRLEEFRKISEASARRCMDCSHSRYNDSAGCPGACLADEMNRRHLAGKNPYCTKERVELPVLEGALQ